MINEMFSRGVAVAQEVNWKVLWFDPWIPQNTESRVTPMHQSGVNVGLKVFV